MTAGSIHRLKSGGVLVDVGDEFPVWRADAGAARRLLLERDLLRHHFDVPASSSVAPGLPASPGGPAAGSTSPDSAAT
jgi:hypothetical protein